MLDALRGVAVFLMIEQHLGVWLWRGPGPGESLANHAHLVGFNALGGGAAPLFVTLAGVGTSLMASKGKPGTDRILVTRGLVLMGFGLLLNLVTPSWFSWGSWFVLHMMGFAIATAPLWRRLPTWALLAVGLAVLAATPVVQEWLHTPLKLTNPRMRRLDMPGGPLRLAFAEGQFPVLPWLAFFMAGMVAGRFIHAGQIERIRRLGGLCLMVGGLMAVVFGLRVPLPDVLGRAVRLHLGFYPASPTFVLLLAGAVLLLMAWGLRREQRKPIADDHWLVTMGRGSLTLLLVHVPLFREATRPVGMWRAMGSGTALGIILVFLLVCAVLTRQWQRGNYRFGAEWALRKLAG